jgi:glycosyltransferase involved in cell wall biosynthesis
LLNSRADASHEILLRGWNKLQPTILVSANSFWNIVNFRSGLIQALTARGVRVAIASPDGIPDREIELPVDVHRIPMDRSGVNPFADGHLALRYARLMRRLRPRALLTYTIKPNIYGALAARLAGIPSIVNISGLGTAFIRDGLFSRFVGALYRVALAKAHVVFFQNPDDRELFLSRRIVNPGNVRMLPGSGIDLKRFALAPPLTAETPPTFLFVGRLLTDKGVREFVEAAEVTKSQCPGARFQLLGDLDPGNRTAVSEEELGRWVAGGTVEYLGPTSDVRPFIAGASAVVLPSYREGLPRSLLEGGAMGRPLIATDVPGCREIVQDGVTGVLCQVRSAASLANAMARFIAMDLRHRQALGHAARRKVESEYDEQLVINAYLEVLEPLIGTMKP